MEIAMFSIKLKRRNQTNKQKTQTIQNNKNPQTNQPTTTPQKQPQQKTTLLENWNDEPIVLYYCETFEYFNRIFRKNLPF